MPAIKPNVKMRRTRWDQKHDEDPLPSSSNWNDTARSSHNQVPVDWNHESNSPLETTGRSRDHLNTPHPLDYSSRQSDERSDGSELLSKEVERGRKTRSHHKESAADVVPDNRPPLYPIPPMPYVADLRPIYTGSNHNAQIGYQSQISWDPGFFSNYHPSMYNLKWWEDVDPHMPHHNLNKDKYDVGRSGPWSKMNKSNDRNSAYDFSRRYGKIPTASLDRSNRTYREQRPFLHSNNMNQRYGKFDNKYIWRNNNGNNSRCLNSDDRREFSNFYDWNQNSVNQESYRTPSNIEKSGNNFSKEARNDKTTVCSNGDIINKGKDSKRKKVFRKNCKKNSTAEKAKKKALAIAANKLKMSFLAAKKTPNCKSTKKSKGLTTEKPDSNNKNEINAKDKVQDLSIPKSIPKDGTSLEHDFDIKFSASEWELVGRGEGGTRNFDALPGATNESKEDNSDSDSVVTIPDYEVRDETDVDSENSDYYSEVEDINIEWNNVKHFSPIKPLRRRHVSETCNTNSYFVNTIPNLPKTRRTRSFSTSQVEKITPSNCNNTKSVSSNLKSMLVKQLLTMDKKSLVELVNNPKSRKAQYMMSHFMKMHKVALSQRLNQFRFKDAPSSLNDDDDDDLQILLTISSAQLENLSPDILQQVKEILELEENGNAQQVWEEVSLSLSDLVSGFKDTSTSFQEKTLEIPTIPEEIGSMNDETVITENVDDPDCQIVTPPPKRPATTITIPDSDTDNGSEGKNSDDKNKFFGEEASPGSSDEQTSSFIKPNEFVKLNPPNLINQSNLLTVTLPPLNQFVSPLPVKETVNNPSDCLEKELLTPVRSYTPPLPIGQSSIPALSNLDQSIPALSQFISPLPIKQSPAPTPNVFEHSMSPFLTPHPIKQSPAPSIACHSDTLPAQQHTECSPHSAVPQSCFRPLKRIRRDSGSKNKSEESLLQAGTGNQDGIPLSTHSLKVKLERPSPIIECGYCLHPPRSPHTPQCGYSFNIQPPAPVPLLPASPRSLGPSSQRSVSHIPSSMPRLFKQEKIVSFVSLNHINRPSSEERPKNPAPPDTANSEPPSPLPLLSPRPANPPPPERPMSYTPEDGFSVPTCSNSPPPRQQSPRIIKTERQTPQYICCCMRNECERNNISRTSADFRRAGTPINQLCDFANQITPHFYKTEPPYLPGSRSRTPRSGILGGMFPIPQAPRCLSTINNVMQNGISNNCHNIIGLSKISVGVQTSKAKPCPVNVNESFLSNITLPIALTPLSVKIDQTTSTEDLSFEEIDHVTSMAEEIAINEAEIDNAKVVEGPEVSNLSKLRNAIPIESSNIALTLLDFSKQEKEIYQQLQIIEKKCKELSEERVHLTKCLENINNLRSEKLKKLILGETSENSDPIHAPVGEESSINLVNSSLCTNTMDIEKEEPLFSDNMYLVTSSQEISALHRTDSPAESYSNDSEKHNIHRCTSTSLIVNESDDKSTLQNMDQNDPQFSVSDSDAENKLTKTFQRNKIKFSLAQNCYRRQRMDSVSSSEEEMDKRSHSQHNLPNNLLGNGLVHDTKIEIHEFKQEDDSVLNKFTVSHRVENNDDCEGLGHNRKNSLSSSPQSPKIRNSSGSEHGYSLRSRGPPNDLLDFNSDSQLSKDATMSSQEDHVDICEEKPSVSHKNSNKNHQDDEQADDELERDDNESKILSSHKLSSDSHKRRKRKRKNNKTEVNKCKKKIDINGVYQANAVHLQDDNNRTNSPKSATKEAVGICKEREETIFKAPQRHEAPILDLKVVGNFIFTASSDGTARLFDPSTGLILATYVGHTNSVTAIQVIGQPDFRPVAPDFSVITGSEDHSINVYDGKTGALSKSKIATEPVRCFAHRWGYLFIGTDGGCGIKWNLKDKKLGEKIQFCGKGITQLIAHIEGGRKVLVVCAKTTPIMVRDAMSGLFLRTLEYMQLTVYSAIFEGSLLYTGGSDKNIHTHDFCSGTIKKTFLVGTSVSGLLLVSDHLIAVCYDGCVRVFKLPNGELTHCINVESSHKMYICSSLYKDQILLGNKNGEIVSCPLPELCK